MAETYRVVRAGSVQDLEQKVEALMAEGWLPQGGVHGGGWWCQAMVKPPTMEEQLSAMFGDLFEPGEGLVLEPDGMVLYEQEFEDEQGQEQL